MGYDLDMEFEWDESKAFGNLKKHGVSFSEAKTVFNNPLAVIFDDPLHSVDEQREIIIGHSQTNRLLLVSFTESSNAIRIISARPATRRERQDYEQNAFQ
ncbi:BrnT family toxin [Moorena producens JHB]|uniref:BrnT family toxin n=1 Tax=Moorena producens (strain JHB) TaxID=1454205 RepID=A0A1D9GBJ2_MOOP1|nr:BrnT family toxin [Moorena producens]AOY84983.2 BrnT family toxin [Moorena producens JHB]